MEISLRAQSMPESPIRKLAKYADEAKLAGIHVYHAARGDGIVVIYDSDMVEGAVFSKGDCNAAAVVGEVGIGPAVSGNNFIAEGVRGAAIALGEDR